MPKWMLAAVVTVALWGAWVALDQHDWLGLGGLGSRVLVNRYTCPMHRHVHSESPGHCPICGMDLVPIGEVQAAELPPGQFEPVHLSAQVRNKLSIRTARVKRGDLHRSIDALGKITRIDPTARRVLTPPIGGRLTYLATKYQGDEVERGELLFSVSSGRLRQMQSDFQRAFRKGHPGAADAMIPTLRRWGLTVEDISALQAGAEPEFPVSVYAAEPGVVFAQRGKVGDPVATGFTVFNLGSDYQVAEVTAEIFERQWSRVARGQPATMRLRSMPGILFHGAVSRVEPPVGYTTRSLEIKLKFKTNDRRIAQSTFAHVHIEANTRHQLLLAPSDAIIRTGGGERVVLVRDDGSFNPVEVVAGEESMGFTEIVSGLKEGEMVVVSGQFLIDSESNILAGLRRLSSPEVDTSEARSGQPSAQGRQGRQGQRKAPARRRPVDGGNTSGAGDDS